MSALDYLLKANLYGLLLVSCYWIYSLKMEPMVVPKGVYAQSDSTKKQPVKLRAKPVQPVKQTSETRYSAPGHYTVTVPRDNTPGGKADLILVNGTKQVDRIGDVDSNTIESIELLKDTKSIARYKLLYGEKAAKGIVIIHLKGTNTL
ncbi:hypothetical protein GCM10028819_06640 [Spirosoma humi]